MAIHNIDPESSSVLDAEYQNSGDVRGTGRSVVQNDTKSI